MWCVVLLVLQMEREEAKKFVELMTTPLRGSRRTDHEKEKKDGEKARMEDGDGHFGKEWMDVVENMRGTLERTAEKLRKTRDEMISNADAGGSGDPFVGSGGDAASDATTVDPEHTNVREKSVVLPKPMTVAESVAANAWRRMLPSKLPRWEGKAASVFKWLEALDRFFVARNVVEYHDRLLWLAEDSSDDVRTHITDLDICGVLPESWDLLLAELLRRFGPADPRLFAHDQLRSVVFSPSSWSAYIGTFQRFLRFLRLDFYEIKRLFLSPLPDVLRRRMVENTQGCSTWAELQAELRRQMDVEDYTTQLGAGHKVLAQKSSVSSASSSSSSQKKSEKKKAARREDYVEKELWDSRGREGLCQVCGAGSHRTPECPKRSKKKEATGERKSDRRREKEKREGYVPKELWETRGREGLCQVCGDPSHGTGACPTRKKN